MPDDRAQRPLYVGRDRQRLELDVVRKLDRARGRRRVVEGGVQRLEQPMRLVQDGPADRDVLPESGEAHDAQRTSDAITPSSSSIASQCAGSTCNGAVEATGVAGVTTTGGGALGGAPKMYSCSIRYWASSSMTAGPSGDDGSGAIDASEFIRGDGVGSGVIMPVCAVRSAATLRRRPSARSAAAAADCRVASSHSAAIVAVCCFPRHSATS